MDGLLSLNARSGEAWRKRKDERPFTTLDFSLSFPQRGEKKKGSHSLLCSRCIRVLKYIYVSVANGSLSLLPSGPSADSLLNDD